jgi:uncharacterized membrane protein
MSASGRRGSVDASPTQEGSMAIGPVQLLVLGFNHPRFQGEIIDELERLRASDTVRVIDALAVYKDRSGDVAVEHLSNLSEAQAAELGSKVAMLVGLDIEGDESPEIGGPGGGQVFDEGAAWDVIGEIPNDTAAALVLLEHHWAVGLRDAIARANGFRIADGFIDPMDLVAIGLMAAEEAEDLRRLDAETAMAGGGR